MEIANRHILITGANRGIGRALAKVCAQDKSHLHLVMRQSDPDLLKELKNEGAKSVTLWEVDLGSREGVQNLLNQLADTPIDILFNNAGVLTGGLLEEQGLDDIYKMFQVNVNSLVHLTHGLLPGMLSRKRGKIINNSSVSAYMNFPAASTYAASKAAVAAFTNSLRLELAETPVTTLLLITPAVRTRMFDELGTLYSKNFKLPIGSLPPSKYAEMIREAILHDLEVLEPPGLAGWGLKVAKYISPLFELEVGRRFRRHR